MAADIAAHSSPTAAGPWHAGIRSSDFSSGVVVSTTAPSARQRFESSWRAAAATEPLSAASLLIAHEHSVTACSTSSGAPSECRNLGSLAHGGE